MRDVDPPGQARACAARQRGAHRDAVHVFLADASLKERGVLRNWSDSAAVLSTEIVPDADHLSIVRHPRMLASLKRLLAQAQVPA